ncbi:MAG: hypothetical protein ACYDER_05065 [Ktedonobacteraceae bacterium]
MKDWLDSIPTGKLLDTFQELKDELTEHYREELKLLTEDQFLVGGKRAEFYEKEKEIVMKLILLAGGYEVTQIMHECWRVARYEYPMSRAYGPCYLLPCQRDKGV